MKVKELIKRLKQSNPNAEIWITYIEDGYQEVTTDNFKIEDYYNTAYGHSTEFKIGV